MDNVRYAMPECDSLRVSGRVGELKEKKRKRLKKLRRIGKRVAIAKPWEKWIIDKIDN